jgi:hypothetical protein
VYDPPWRHAPLPSSVDDRPRGAGEHLAVVRDEQHRLARGRDLRLERALGGDVEEVVGLVEQQDVDVRGQQHIEDEALALAARQRPRGPVGDVGERRADDRPARAVPLRLELVAAELGPFADRGAQVHPRAGVARGERALGPRHPLAGGAQGVRGERDQQLAHRPLVVGGADVLAHEAGAAADRGLTVVGRQLAGEDPQQRALADAVGADQADVLARRDREGHVAEEQVAAGVRVGEPGAADVAHGPKPSTIARSTPTRRSVSAIETRSSTAWARASPPVPTITVGMPRSANRRMSAP